MKNVQMRINPELYAQFKRVDGESNNERMAKLLDDSKQKYRLVGDNEMLNGLFKRTAKQYEDHTRELWAMYSNERRKSKTLASALVVSITVSVCYVAYVCVTNGWFL